MAEYEELTESGREIIALVVIRACMQESFICTSDDVDRALVWVSEHRAHPLAQLVLDGEIGMYFADVEPLFVVLE